MSTIINASTSSGLIQTADTSGTLVLQSNGTTMQTIDSTGSYGQLKSGTAVASTSGTSIDFTGLPSWVKRITVMLTGVSTNGTSNLLIQLGYSGGIENTGYTSAGGYIQNASASGVSTSTAGFIFNTASASNSIFGSITVCTIGSNIWVAQGLVTAASVPFMMAGGKTTTGTLDRVRITTVNGTDTFDAGSINIMYEG